MNPEYELFAEVVERGSLSAAGRSMGVSPAMVSKRLARLEARLGARLIHRTTRRLVLTPAGQQFYDRVAAILSAARDAEQEVTGQAGAPSGLLRISAPTSFGRLHIAPHLKGFLDLHPRIQMQINLTDAYVDLLSERIDLAVRIASHIDVGLTGRLLAPNRRILCAGSAYLAAQGVPRTLGDLTARPLLAADGQLPWRLEGPEGPVALDGASLVRTNSSEVIRELAIAGMGVALRSTWDIGQDLACGRLQRVLPQYGGAADVGIYAVFPRSAFPTPNIQAFVDYFETAYLSAEGAPGSEPVNDRVAER